MKKIYTLLLSALAVFAMQAAPAAKTIDMSNLQFKSQMPVNTRAQRMTPVSNTGIQPLGNNEFMRLADFTDRPWTLISGSFYTNYPGTWSQCVNLDADPDNADSNGVKIYGFFGFTKQGGYAEEGVFLKGSINVDQNTLSIPYGQQLKPMTVTVSGQEILADVYFVMATPVLNGETVTGLTPSFNGSIVASLKAYQSDLEGGVQYVFEFPDAEYVGLFLRNHDTQEDLGFINALVFMQLPEANAKMEYEEYILNEDEKYGDETRSILSYVQSEVYTDSTTGDLTFELGPVTSFGDGQLLTFIYSTRRKFWTATEQSAYYDGEAFYLSTYYPDNNSIDNDLLAYSQNDDHTIIEFDPEYEWCVAAGHGIPSETNVFRCFPPCKPATITRAFYTNAYAGIEDVAIDQPQTAAPTVYYNMQGMQVANPVAGQVYIRCQGNKAEKILVK